MAKGAPRADVGAASRKTRTRRPATDTKPPTAPAKVDTAADAILPPRQSPAPGGDWTSLLSASPWGSRTAAPSEPARTLRKPDASTVAPIEAIIAAPTSPVTLPPTKPADPISTLIPRPQPPAVEWTNLLAVSPWVKPTSAPIQIVPAIDPPPVREPEVPLEAAAVRVFWEPDPLPPPTEPIEPDDAVEENIIVDAPAQSPAPMIWAPVPLDVAPFAPAPPPEDAAIEPDPSRVLSVTERAEAEIEAEIDEQIDGMKKVPVEDCLLGIFRLARNGIDGVLRAGSRSAPLLADGTAKLSGVIGAEMRRLTDRFGSPRR